MLALAMNPARRDIFAEVSITWDPVVPMLGRIAELEGQYAMLRAECDAAKVGFR
jgi:hypothetical protein